MALGLMKLAFAFIAAVLAPACLMTLWYLYGQFMVFEPNDPYIWVRTRGFLVICLLTSAAYVFLLGLPAYLLLRWRKAVRWWSTISPGFILAALPVALMSWPLRYAGMGSSSSVNGVDMMIAGVPTTAGWIQYVEGLMFFGCLGALSGLVFWLASRSMSPN